MRVDVEKVVKLKKELLEINKRDLKDIELYENGKRIEISKEQMDEWDFVGLNTTDFIMERVWEREAI